MICIHRTREKGCEFALGRDGNKENKRLGSLYKRRSWKLKTKLAETVPLKDNARLTEKLSDEISQKHLDKLISVQLIVDMHDGVEPKVKMLYFCEKWHNTHAIRT